jgi:hypothetical protein
MKEKEDDIFYIHWNFPFLSFPSLPFPSPSFLLSLLPSLPSFFNFKISESLQIKKENLIKIENE